MKSSILFLLLSLALSSSSLANGVGVIDASTAKYLRLDSSITHVKIDNQVAIVTTRQSFRNMRPDSARFKYAYPLPASASAISLKWWLDGASYEAYIAAQPQDTTLPGGGGGGGSSTIDPKLKEYLGESPLLFDILQGLAPEESFSIELTYVQLLGYELGQVALHVPNNYSLISTAALLHQSFVIELNSSRTIDSFYAASHSGATISNDGHLARISFEQSEQPATTDLRAIYQLNSNEFGLYGYSTYRDSSVDELGRGFLLFLVEPDASESTEALQKIFTLIVDRSGSMSGDKIIQARNATRFIVENLNQGDLFNVILFSDQVVSIFPHHRPYTLENKMLALDRIDALTAGGSTNISGALSTALDQYSAGSEAAKIILFFTDGQPTAGITDPAGILSAVRSRNSEKNVTIFPFGIGSDVNQQLLTVLAKENNGIADFLLQSELQEKISRFYLKVRNPVLLDPQITFEPNVVQDIYPKSLPHLYKGQQLLVSGRYSEAVDPLKITLTGTAFGQPVTYNYDLTLASAMLDNYAFLPKVWAKMKIEDLTIRWRSLDPGSDSAEALKREITDISLKYGVITNFTSFQTDWQTAEVDLHQAEITREARVYPSPFLSAVTIEIASEIEMTADAKVNIFDATGRHIRSLSFDVATNQIKWDGLDESGAPVPPGVYICVITAGNQTIAIKLQKA